MTATPLADIHLPERALTELRGVDADEWIHNHAIPVGRPWWTQTLSDHGLEDTLTGETIRRADIFALADPAADDPAAALTLLWNSLAWGSGDKRRNNKARIAAIAADPDAAAALLQQAAARSRTDPQAAYDLLYPRNRTAISDLGPAFFTKYLYFAGGGDPAHPCAILSASATSVVDSASSTASTVLSVIAALWVMTMRPSRVTRTSPWPCRRPAIGRRCR
jgi:hypothetical protein